MAALLHAGLVLAQEHDRFGVQGDAAHLVGLGVLLLAHAAELCLAAADLDDSFVEVDAGAAEGAGFAAADAGGHDEPDEGAPVFVEREGLLDEAGGFGG